MRTTFETPRDVMKVIGYQWRLGRSLSWAYIEANKFKERKGRTAWPGLVQVQMKDAPHPSSVLDDPAQEPAKDFDIDIHTTTTTRRSRISGTAQGCPRSSTELCRCKEQDLLIRDKESE